MLAYYAAFMLASVLLILPLLPLGLERVQEGFGGLLCTQCLNDLVHWGDVCVDCSAVSWGYALLLLLLSFAVLGYLLFVPSVVVDSTGGQMGWTTLHHKFVSRVLLFQTLAPTCEDMKDGIFCVLSGSRL